MRRAYTSTEPGPGAALRPLVPFRVEGCPLVFDGLLDTGAINTVLDADVARLASILLRGPEDVVSIGGRRVRVIRQAGVLLTIGSLRLRGEVLFADNWHQPFHVLGSTTVLRQLVATFDGPAQELEIREAA